MTTERAYAAAYTLREIERYQARIATLEAENEDLRERLMHALGECPKCNESRHNLAQLP